MSRKQVKRFNLKKIEQEQEKLAQHYEDKIIKYRHVLRTTGFEPRTKKFMEILIEEAIESQKLINQQRVVISGLLQAVYGVAESVEQLSINLLAKTEEDDEN